MKYTDREVQAPLCCISTTSSLENKTGSWRFASPVFIERTSPCNQQCTAGEDIAGYMCLASQGRFEDAWRLIMKKNPFPAVMGRVCYHSCETKCNRAEHDEAVSINMVERFIGDYGLAHNIEIEPTHPQIDKRVAIVGAGPAGLAAAYHLRLRGYAVTVFDANELPGGLMRYGIPLYRLPKEILDGEIGRLSNMGIDFNMGVKIGGDLAWAKIDSGFDAVLVAVGAYKEVGLEIKDTDKKGVFNALEFLREVNLGKWPDTGRKVAVIGGGNSAIDCARVSRRLGADVTLVYRRSQVEMPAHPEEVEMAREEGVEFIFLASPKEIYGQGEVSGIGLLKMSLGEADSSGRRRPESMGKTFDLNCQTVIMAIGESLRTEDLPPFIIHEGGRVKTDNFGRIKGSKFFAGGDIIDIPRSVTHAIGSGKRTAVAIDGFLKGMENHQNPGGETIGYSGLNPFYFDHRPRTKTHIVPVDKRLRGFQEIVASPSEKESVYEAGRCFNCGSCTECGNCYVFCPDCSIIKDPDGYRYVVDLDYCKGCGICVQECPRGAMKMEFME
ncbi:MAG: FAD-dependent oxidoreductase [Desulfobacteraceae bacterium]|nr:MAG: FAD-dependent oxidoreductase [Desulfobacteraceae bacterium]